MSYYSEDLQDVINDLTEEGINITVISNEQVAYDTETGSVTSNEITQTCKGVKLNWNLKNLEKNGFDKNLITQNDYMLIADGRVRIELNNVVILNNKRYVVMHKPKLIEPTDLLIATICNIREC